jgi:hypothetical protein
MYENRVQNQWNRLNWTWSCLVKTRRPSMWLNHKTILPEKVQYIVTSFIEAERLSLMLQRLRIISK